MEMLSRQLRKLRLTQPFHYHPKCAKINLTHLIFADDLLLFAKGDKDSVTSLLTCLQNFAFKSGLGPSPAKTSVFFGGVGQGLKKEILEATGFSEGHLPFKYLGVPLSGGRLKVAQYGQLIDHIASKIHHWTALNLSHAGKIQLINSVLSSVLVYWCSVFMLPKAVVTLIYKQCRDFYWGDKEDKHKVHWLKWETFIKPRKEGGVGIKEILSWNKAFIVKWIWKLHTNSTSIWLSWANAYLLRGATIWNVQPRGTDSWIWREMLYIRDELLTTIGSDSDAVVQLQSWERIGKFSINKAYNFFRPIFPVVLKLKCLWDSVAIPKHQIVGWLAYHKRLATLDNLQHRGIQLANKCCLCNAAQESHQHLFFQCSFMGDVWRAVQAWLGNTRRPRSFTRELEYIHRSCTTGDSRRVSIAALLAIVYHGWIERNNRIFNGVQQSWQGISSKIKFEVACRIHSKFSLSSIESMECMYRG